MAVQKKTRVAIPTAPTELLLLEAVVYAKHLADGATSVLKTMQDHYWTIQGPKIALAKVEQNKAEDYKLKMEKK